MSSERSQSDEQLPIISSLEYYSDVRAEKNEQPGIEFLRSALEQCSKEAREVCKKTEDFFLKEPSEDARIALRTLGFVLSLDETKKLDPSISEQADKRHDFSGLVSQINLLLAFVPEDSPLKSRSRETIAKLQALVTTA